MSEYSGTILPASIKEKLLDNSGQDINHVIAWASPSDDITKGNSHCCCCGTVNQDRILSCIPPKIMLPIFYLPCCWPCAVFIPIFMAEYCMCSHFITGFLLPDVLNDKTWIVTDDSFIWIRNSGCLKAEPQIIPLTSVTKITYRNPLDPKDKEMEQMGHKCCYKVPPKLSVERRRRNQNHRKVEFPQDVFIGCPPEFYEAFKEAHLRANPDLRLAVESEMIDRGLEEKEGKKEWEAKLQEAWTAPYPKISAHDIEGTWVSCTCGCTMCDLTRNKAINEDEYIEDTLAICCFGIPFCGPCLVPCNDCEFHGRRTPNTNGFVDKDNGVRFYKSPNFMSISEGGLINWARKVC